MTDTKGCCFPRRTPALKASYKPHYSTKRHSEKFETVKIPAAKSPILGTAEPLIIDDGEKLRKSHRIKSFRITSTAITNAEFAMFADETGYVTEAERLGWSFVFWSDIPTNIAVSQGVVGMEWWRRIKGANWRDINGPGTRNLCWHPSHPVVQVSWNDAAAFALWAGGRLPTETEWEHAARGGLGDVPYPWGFMEPNDIDYQPCNIWQGEFPNTNTAADGFKATAPALSFNPNNYGLYNTVGNVWEWTASTYRIRSLKKTAKEREHLMAGHKVSKGGSFLCHQSYCWRYRIAARLGNSPDTSTPHMGFRLAFE